MIFSRSWGYIKLDLPINVLSVVIENVLFSMGKKGKLFLYSFTQKHVPRDIKMVIRSPKSRS